MKIRITEKGVYDPSGNRVAIGTILNVAGDTVPSWLTNKAIPAGDDETPLIVNPAPVSSTVAPVSSDDPEQIEKGFLSEYAESLGITVDPSWSLETLKAEISMIEQGAM